MTSVFDKKAGGSNAADSQSASYHAATHNTNDRNSADRSPADRSPAAKDPATKDPAAKNSATSDFLAASAAMDNIADNLKDSNQISGQLSDTRITQANEGTQGRESAFPLAGVQPTFDSIPTFSQQPFSGDFSQPSQPSQSFQAFQPSSGQSATPPVTQPRRRLTGYWGQYFAFFSLEEVKYIISLFVSTRIVLTAIGLVSYTVLPTGYGKQVSWSAWRWLDLWGVWDSLWYMDIAQNGYSTLSKLSEFPAQTNLAFFPLYPMLMKGLGDLMGGHYFLAGLLISNTCMLIACFLLYQLVQMQWNKAIARRSVKYLFLFPVSFILSGVFTESLFLCLSLLCFYLAKRRQWWLAGLFGALMSATRTLGVLIALPLLFEYLKSLDFQPRRIRSNGLFLALIPLGLLAFCVYSYQITGDFLFFKTNQAAWGRELMSPVTAFWQGLSDGITEPSFKKLLECAFFAATLGLLSWFYRQVGFAYWLLGMYSIFVPLSTGVDSMPRFTLPIFPLFIALALLSCKTGWNRWMTLGLGLLQGALMVLWCTGQGLVI